MTTSVIPLTIPKLGLTMTEATLAQWVAAEDEPVGAGETVAVIETDKVSYEIGAPSAGRLGRRHARPGDVLPVGALIADWLCEAGQSSAGEPMPEAETGPVIRSPAVKGDPPASRIIATPLARRLARRDGIDLSQVQGSGPRGRIKAADLQAAAMRPGSTPSTATRAPADLVSPTRVERTMAQRMTEAKPGIPHFYMTMDVDATALRALQRQVSDTVGSVSLTAFLLAAVVRALVAHPRMRRVWSADGFRSESEIDIGLAVDTEHGLFNPVLRGLDQDDLMRIAGKARSAVERCRGGRLAPEDVGGGCVTVSNAGIFGIKYVTPIIVPAQSAIIGVGALSPVFRPNRKGKPKLRNELGLVVAADHRVHTGADVARFMDSLKGLLEHPLAILLGTARHD